MGQPASKQVVGDVLRARAREHPDKLFWVAGDDRATYAEADARSDRVAAGLAELGVEQGDRVAVLSPNRPEYLETIFGLAKLGAIQVPLNAYLRGDFLQYQVDQAEATVAITDAPGAEALLGVRDRVPSLSRIVTFDDVPDAARDVEILPFEQLRASHAAVPAPELSPSDLVSIMYTSGTTGMPKGCMLPHGYYVHFGSTIKNVVEVRDDSEIVFTALPLFHGHAQIVVLMSVLYEGHCVAIDPAFHVSSILDRWRETGATIFHGVGMMCVAMLKQPPSEKDRTHRMRTGFSIPLPPQLQQEFHERFGVTISSYGYGQTECMPTMALPGEAPAGSAGRPTPHYDVAVVNDEGDILPPGEVGEIVVRPKGANMMYAGYWRQPEATVKAWQNFWHHTGDSGRFDEGGFLYFVDRKKDALRRRGENISSVEVEAAILKHPKVSEAAIVAAPSELTEDEVMAHLVLTDGEVVEPNELFEFFRSALPYFVIPRYVRIVDELPKTATLRVRKHALRSEGIPDDVWDFEAMDLRVGRGERR